MNVTYPSRWFGSGRPLAWPSWAPGLNKTEFFFNVGIPEGALLRSPCQTCRISPGKASASCIAVDANVLRPVRENTVRFSAGQLALNGSRSEHLLQPHGSHFFLSSDVLRQLTGYRHTC